MKEAWGADGKPRFIPRHMLIFWTLILAIKLLIFEIGDFAVVLVVILLLLCLTFALTMFFQHKYSIGQKITALVVSVSMLFVIASPIQFLYESARFRILKPAYTSCAEKIAGELMTGGVENIGRGEYPLTFPESLLPRGENVASYTYDGEGISIGFIAFNSLNDWGSYVYLSDGNAEGWLRNKNFSKMVDEYTINCYSYESLGDKWFYVLWG